MDMLRELIEHPELLIAAWLASLVIFGIIGYLIGSVRGFAEGRDATLAELGRPRRSRQRLEPTARREDGAVYCSHDHGWIGGRSGGIA